MASMPHARRLAALSIEQRFDLFVEKTATCWLWKGNRNRQGYGRTGVHGKYIAIHRYAFERFRHRIPAGMSVLHRCDNPPCCNPAHLFLGTLADNRRDCVAKGRQARGNSHMSHTKPASVARGDRHGSHLHPERVARGSRSANAALTEDQIRDIRTRLTSKAATQVRIAAEYGITQGNVRLCL